MEKYIENPRHIEIQILADRLKTISIEKVFDRMGFPMNYGEIVRL